VLLIFAWILNVVNIMRTSEDGGRSKQQVPGGWVKGRCVTNEENSAEKELIACDGTKSGEHDTMESDG
jgi:hypothetical protein